MSTMLKSAAAAVVLPVTASNANVSIIPSSPNGTGRLVELGREIEELERAFIQAEQNRNAALAKYRELCPTTPEELILTTARRREFRFFDHCATAEVDITGKKIDGPKNEPCRDVFMSHLLQAEVVGKQISRNTKDGKRLRHLARIAKSYEKAKAHAEKASGYEEADSAFNRAAWAVEEVAYEISDLEPRTHDEIVIYARALKAFARAELADHYNGRAGQLLGDKLAVGILRLAA
jgi:DNA-directed RNA polymerase subunit F